jgi:ABC-2 type transport system permease protein
MMVVIMNAYSNATFAFFMLRFQRSIEEILVSPTDENILLSGFCIASIVRGLLTGLIVTIVSILFTHDVPQHIGILIISAVLAALFFSLLGFTNAIYAKKFDDISTIPTFVLTPLIYLGGIFYSISQLPHAWQLVCYFNPIVYIVSLFRYGFLGIASTSITYSLMTLIVLISMMYAFNLYLLRKGVGIRT